MAVKIFGKTVSTPAAAAIAGGSGLAIYFAYKQHKASQASASGASNPSAIDPVTGLPYSQDQQIDPLTGQAYLAEAQQYGSVSAAEQAVAASSSLDYSSAYGTGYGAVGTSSAAPLVTANTTQATTYASNSAWAQAVEAGLSTIGYSSTDIAAALGRYLGNLSETPDQASIVGAALAEFGPPPVGSYQIILAPATTSTGSGSTGSGTTDGAGTTGSTTSSIGTAYPAPGNLHQTVYPTQASLAATAVPNALCHWQVLRGGQSVIDSSATTSSSGAFHAEATGLAPKTAYQWRVAVDQSGTNKASAWSNGSFTTT